MKIIYQEKDNPDSVGEFEILDDAQIEILERESDDFIVVSDKEENNTRYKIPKSEKNYYNQGIYNPLNLGYPPSKIPSYHSKGIVKAKDCYCPNCKCSNQKFRLCAYRYTYLWLKNGKAFWCYPTHITGTIISGWKWKNYKWKFFSMPVKRINNFYCYR